ncbi:MAG TPA: DUF4287 domain-containing protein [Candidatus Dormibacteraeota bacterium]|nr:DUF4287 domain-containing protein [Candidatus Dormibacteraeota bacterium]
MSPANTRDPKFQSYLNNIKAKTGKSPEDFVRAARTKGLLDPKIKTGEIVAWLQKDYDLGRGHAMAVVVILKEAMPKAK